MVNGLRWREKWENDDDDDYLLTRSTLRGTRALGLKRQYSTVWQFV